LLFVLALIPLFEDDEKSWSNHVFPQEPLTEKKITGRHLADGYVGQVDERTLLCDSQQFLTI
jgi:hypothetical protein